MLELYTRLLADVRTYYVELWPSTSNFGEFSICLKDCNGFNWNPLRENFAVKAMFSTLGSQVPDFIWKSSLIVQIIQTWRNDMAMSSIKNSLSEQFDDPISTF